MFVKIAYFPIAGIFLFRWIGVLGLACLLVAAGIQAWNFWSGRPPLPFRWHPTVAIIGLCLVAIHASLLVLSLLGW